MKYYTIHYLVTHSSFDMREAMEEAGIAEEVFDVDEITDGATLTQIEEIIEPLRMAILQVPGLYSRDHAEALSNWIDECIDRGEGGLWQWIVEHAI